MSQCYNKESVVDHTWSKHIRTLNATSIMVNPTVCQVMKTLNQKSDQTTIEACLCRNCQQFIWQSWKFDSTALETIVKLFDWLNCIIEITLCKKKEREEKTIAVQSPKINEAIILINHNWTMSSDYSCSPPQVCNYWSSLINVILYAIYVCTASIWTIRQSVYKLAVYRKQNHKTHPITSI